MGKIPVALIDKNKSNIDKIESLVKNIPEVTVSLKSVNLDDLEFLLQEKAESIVFLGPTFTLKAAEKLFIKYCSALRYVKVILLVEKTSTALLREAIKLDIHDVLEFPFNFEDLSRSLERVKAVFNDIMEENGKGEPESLKVKEGAKKITIFSTKGGSGKSFIAINLAVDLIGQTKNRVSLFDLNYQFGDIALMLNLFPKHTIYDIMSVIDQLDSEMLQDFLTEHSSGVKVLPAPIDPTQDEAISTETTKKILNILSEISDYIIIDTSSGFGDNVLLLLEETDCLVIVTSMDVPSIKNLKITLQLLDQLKFPEEKMFLVLNRAGTKVGITEDEIRKTIAKKIDINIPSNRLVPLTINKGIPLVTEAPRATVSRSIRKLTNLIKKLN
ncbi:CpaE family protein [Actinomycetota bacterium]